MTSRHPPGSLRERKRAAAKAAVAEAAIGLFAERGYDAVSVAEICEVANVAPRSFFRYFPTKKDLLLEPFRDMADGVTGSIASAPSDMSDREVIQQAMRELARHVLVDWDRIMRYLRVLQGAAAVRAAPELQFADLEREYADTLMRRRGAAGSADWRTRLFVARIHSGFRVWFDELTDRDVEDPLGLLDQILAEHE
ncbi:TetR/AcrR family transcriptional regulator [Conexibacter sp. CPCC 206217]|uniref:TetR/AcrR family transcriptional regulator n=1 Tax=Conexibacter sp. CPCC 206217 TaxID=3064574 RepID=UPI0027228F9E|nr:TetR family transcriptional regulator [Conexibacter sp. CPCC 206217]MDO8211933.1 TetR family transcriptional regulator [Conexibacter sp. CPCC 206217]